MPAANQRVGEYVLDLKVGGGTFGEVWRAHHHVWTDQLVAIKIPIDPQYLRNLQREGSAIHGLVHPNIVRAIGFDPYASTPYLAMEFIPGSSLRPLIKQRLSIPDAVAILRQVLAGLTYAHANNIIHRDIKPENILIHEQASAGGFATPGMVKVTDFGLGKGCQHHSRIDRLFCIDERRRRPRDCRVIGLHVPRAAHRPECGCPGRSVRLRRDSLRTSHR